MKTVKTDEGTYTISWLMLEHDGCINNLMNYDAIQIRSCTSPHGSKFNKHMVVGEKNGVCIAFYQGTGIDAVRDCHELYDAIKTEMFGLLYEGE